MRKIEFTTQTLWSTPKAGALSSLRQMVLLLLTGCFSMLYVTPTQAQCSMACNGSVNISIAGPDQNCSLEVTPEMLGSGLNTSCPGPKSVTLMTQAGVPIPTSPTINVSHVGMTLRYKITHLATGNNCWGNLLVEEKNPPRFTSGCGPISVYCLRDTRPVSEGGAVANPVVDDCSAFTMAYVDDVLQGSCNTAFSGKIVRTWTATDVHGYSSTCSQVITVERVTLADPAFTPICPTNRTLACTAAGVSTSPATTGYPSIYVNGTLIPVIPGMNTMCEIASSFTDERFNLCGGGTKILRTWTIYDWCMSTNHPNNPWTCIQVIQVQDQTPPTITCPATINASTASTTCSGSITLPPATVTDNCSSATVRVITPFGVVNGNGGLLLNIPVGTHTVTYQATDACGNTSSCTATLKMQDLIEPVAICDDFTVISLTADGTAIASAQVFDDGSHDNCSVASFKVRRMASACAPAGAFDDFVSFSCCDIGTNVSVVFRVYDVAGNYNECMVVVQVQDKTAPRLTCPPNKTAFCDDDFSNLNVFGTATATDNCGTPTVTVRDSMNLTACGSGTIFRMFTAVDGVGLRAVCTQTITVTNSAPFTINDIIWPSDYTTNQCGASLQLNDLPTSPINYRQPIINSDFCDNIIVTHTDELLPVSMPACYKILRKWKVIDWCQYNPNASAPAGIWEHVQILKVNDVVAPVITCPSDMVVNSTSATCDGADVTIPNVTATDCSSNLTFLYTIDLGNNGTIDANGTGANASRRFPNGVHKVTYRVEDGCSNASTCSFLVTVRDGKKPSPICVNGISVGLMSTGMITVTPGMLDNGSFDNCTPASGLDLKVVPNTFTCANIGQNTVRLIVTDAAGNSDFCETYVLVQDNMGMCPQPIVNRVAGVVANAAGTGVDAVDVKINSGTNMFANTNTNTLGGYNFDDLTSGNDYTVSPSSNNNPLNGVTTFDILLASRHILGMAPLDSPYKIIAADANGNGRVTTADLVAIRQLILGVTTTFPSNTPSWKFVDRSYVFQNPANPFGENFPQVCNLNNLNTNQMNVNFVAVKTGDVNNTALPNALTSIDDRTFNGKMNIVVEDRQLLAGETIIVPLTIQNDVPVQGLQYTLSFDPALIEVTEVVAGDVEGFEDNNIGTAMLHEGMITTSWDNSKNTHNTFNQNTITHLTIKAKQNTTLSHALQLNSRYTAAEAYAANGDLLSIGMIFEQSNHVTTASLVLYQNQPNPFNGTTTIGFDMPAAGMATLVIYDVTGKRLMETQRQFGNGYNTIDIDAAELKATGVLYFQLSANGETATRKMVVMP